MRWGGGLLLPLWTSWKLAGEHSLLLPSLHSAGSRGPEAVLQRPTPFSQARELTEGPPVPPGGLGSSGKLGTWQSALPLMPPPTSVGGGRAGLLRRAELCQRSGSAQRASRASCGLSRTSVDAAPALTLPLTSSLSLSPPSRPCAAAL